MIPFNPFSYCFVVINRGKTGISVVGLFGMNIANKYYIQNIKMIWGVISIRPLIGVTTYFVHDRELNSNRSRGLHGQDMLMSTMDYSRCIEKAGGVPVAMPVLQSDAYVDELANKLDGFVFSGGPDICPIHYGSSVKLGLGLIVPERDEFELKLLKKVLELNKPVFGICRGFQLINVLFGGTLLQDIKQSQITQLEHVGKMAPKYYQTHKVFIQNESRVFEAYNTTELLVNSFHHQAVDKLGEGLLVTAKSEDNIVEAFEHRDYDFLIGVQWHPEMMAEVYDEQLALFKLFVNIININKGGR